MRNGFQNATDEQRTERQSEKNTHDGAWPFGTRPKHGQAMGQERRSGRLQQEITLGSSELFQRGNQLEAASILDDGFIAGALPIEGKAKSGDPNQWMKPQNTESDLIDEPDQVVAPFRVSRFMYQNGGEFLFTKN